MFFKKESLYSKHGLCFDKYSKILEKYFNLSNIEILNDLWSEPSRTFHNKKHLTSILKEIEKQVNFTKIHVDDYEALIIAAFYHDAIYIPGNTNNEEKSILLFAEHVKKEKIPIVIYKKIINLIEITKYRIPPSTYLEKIFWYSDNNIFNKEFRYWKTWEKKISKEFSHIDKITYKKERIKFLESNVGIFSKKVDIRITKLIKEINKRYIE